MMPHIQLTTEITGADYQADSGLWLVTTAGGGKLYLQILCQRHGHDLGASDP